MVVFPAYAAKCKFNWDLVIQPSPTEELLPPGTVVCFWERKRADTGENMQYLYYLTSPMDVDHIITRDVQGDDSALEYSKKDLYLYGEVRVNEFKLAGLAQTLKDLKDKVKKSAGFSK